LGDQAAGEEEGEGWDEGEDGDEAELVMRIGCWRLVGHCCLDGGEEEEGSVADGGISIEFEM
jgi:hypothetical protein